jgi:acyl-CoA reductase-like NAD-dependent aldehyde dehydrogenase
MGERLMALPGKATADVVHHLVGRKSAPGEGERLVLVDPATEQEIGAFREATPGQVDEAVAAARACFTAGDWRLAAVTRRQAVLRRVARAIRDEAGALAELESACAGLPIAHLAARQVPRAAENFDFFAEVIGQLSGETFEQMPGYLTLVTREAAGVAALLSPWNAPLALSSMQVASCIAFGNSCVVKPSEHTPLAVHRMVELMGEAGLPPGVVNVVHGRGSTTGDALVRHAGVDRIAFTGGTATARHIMAAAAEHLTPVHFELGGKSANIVFADADLDRALDGSLVNSFSNNGQICIAGSRILVERPVADEFIARFVARARALRVGDPKDPATEAGPLAFEAHLERVLAYAELAREEGDVLCGGRRHPDFDRGYYMEPTVVRVANNHRRICQEEVFGPFVTIQVFDEEDEALAIANDSDYGLVAYAWTRDLERALRLQQELLVGTVWVNTSLARDLRAPFGGFKQSGIGRDGPRQSAAFFTEEKATIVPRGTVAIKAPGADGD